MKYKFKLTGKIGKEYLKEYIEKFSIISEDFLCDKISEANEISKIPGDLAVSFLEMISRGKGIRGSLATVGYKVCDGKNFEEMMKASMTMEIFHSAILVHDDIMDQDDLRRGIPTIHKRYEAVGEALRVKIPPSQYGESMAICLGDVGFYFSWQNLLTRNFPAKNLMNAANIYTEYAIRLMHGQVLDVTNVAIQSMSERDILKVLRYKSAEYTAVLPPLFGAALAGEKNKEKLEALKEYGLHFGWAFQIQDDTLSIFGDTTQFGKRVGNDIKEGKNTLFMVHLAKHGTPEQKAYQRSILGNKNITDKDVTKMAQILKKSGSYDYVMNLGWSHVKKGVDLIPKITKNKDDAELLESLIVYMMERTK